MRQGSIWRLQGKSVAVTMAGVILASFGVNAEVHLDGTLGPQAIVSGPNYTIPAEVGQQNGSNLFHSFAKFNLERQEAATFTGPSTVANIIGRVTGGQTSLINGTLRSTI